MLQNAPFVSSGRPGDWLPNDAALPSPPCRPPISNTRDRLSRTKRLPPQSRRPRRGAKPHPALVRRGRARRYPGIRRRLGTVRLAADAYARRAKAANTRRAYRAGVAASCAVAAAVTGTMHSKSRRPRPTWCSMRSSWR
jgi:hypothetical protein